MKTTWRAVVGYEGRYEVSSVGEVRKLSGELIGQWPKEKTGGYMWVRLSGPRQMKAVHRIVAEAFIPNPHNKPNINHIDCDPAHNWVVNLEWCTQAENLAHMTRLGRRAKPNLGKRSTSAILEDGDVRHMRQLHATGQYSWQQLGDLFAVSKHTAGRIVRGETYVDVR